MINEAAIVCEKRRREQVNEDAFKELAETVSENKHLRCRLEELEDLLLKLTVEKMPKRERVPKGDNVTPKVSMVEHEVNFFDFLVDPLCVERVRALRGYH